MDDAYKGKGKLYYTGMGGKKRDIMIDRLGISSYVAFPEDSPEELYMLTVVDDGESIIASSDGSTDKCTIQ
ncbi:MAG: hypothetical protein K5985_04230 [Lachnospiraceae bacterium]|nr:hypothetical protein [Lachnospiraceae bacterium]